MKLDFRVLKLWEETQIAGAGVSKYLAKNFIVKGRLKKVVKPATLKPKSRNNCRKSVICNSSKPRVAK
jgi:hypothetical protein